MSVYKFKHQKVMGGRGKGVRVSVHLKLLQLLMFIFPQITNREVNVKVFYLLFRSLALRTFSFFFLSVTFSLILSYSSKWIVIFRIHSFSITFTFNC